MARLAYWTILIGTEPTSFRAKEPADLVPTLKQLQRQHPEAVMKWFQRGRVWESPVEAAAELQIARRRAPPSGWRPGGKHKDPRAKFQEAKKAKWAAFRQERHDRKIGRPAPREGDRPKSTVRPPRRKAARLRSRASVRVRRGNRRSASHLSASPHSARRRPLRQTALRQAAIRRKAPSGSRSAKSHRSVASRARHFLVNARKATATSVQGRNGATAATARGPASRRGIAPAAERWLQRTAARKPRAARRSPERRPRENRFGAPRDSREPRGDRPDRPAARPAGAGSRPPREERFSRPDRPGGLAAAVRRDSAIGRGPHVMAIGRAASIGLRAIDPKATADGIESDLARRATAIGDRDRSGPPRWRPAFASGSGSDRRPSPAGIGTARGRREAPGPPRERVQTATEPPRDRDRPGPPRGAGRPAGAASDRRLTTVGIVRAVAVRGVRLRARGPTGGASRPPRAPRPPRDGERPPRKRRDDE